jgi:hypothetical protein
VPSAPPRTYNVQLEPPGRERAFRLETEAELFQRIRRESGAPDKVIFPKEPTLPSEKYQGHAWSPLREIVEPGYVCYRRLYFEQINS